MKLRDSGTKIFAIPIFFFLSNAVADVWVFSINILIAQDSLFKNGAHSFKFSRKKERVVFLSFSFFSRVCSHDDSALNAERARAQKKRGTSKSDGEKKRE